MSLIQRSLSGSVLILIIAALRALFLHRLPKRTFLALWAVAVARLLIPYPFRCALSVYSLLGHLTTAAATATDHPLTLTVPAYRAAPLPGTVLVHATAPAAVDLWGIVWGIGALACAAFFAVAYLKCYREFRTSLPVDNEQAKAWLREHRLFRPVEIRQSDRIAAPLTYGVFRPVILMPKTTDWTDSDTLNYVLAHEQVHIRRLDALSKGVLAAALCVHWFNPAVWLLFLLANRDMELACDEAVIRRFGAGTKPAYAMALIRMEEKRSGLTPLYNHFSKNAIEERITAIMKIQKTSRAALIAAVALVIGVATAFATSAQTGNNTSTEDLAHQLDATEPFMGTAMLTSYVSPSDGKTYYSFDGGKTFEPLTDEEFAARFPSPKVEWWTYEEYKEWLENEKIELQSMIGERGWTGSRGEFVWTQQIVDETIAMYEQILSDIGRGMLYSKTIDGEADTSLMMSMDPADIWVDTYEADATSADFTQYQPFGLVWDDDEKALYFNGERVRYFLDGVDLDGTGAMAIYLEYADAGLKGEIDVHTVRQRVENADGSFDPMGPLVGLEADPPAEYDARTDALRVPAAREAETATAQEIAEDLPDKAPGQTSVAEGNAAEPGMTFAQRFEKYAPFGITYEEAEGFSGRGNVYYNGQLVRRFSDQSPGGGAFTFSSAEQGGIAVKTVYDGGRLTGVEIAGD